jgi:hypothetical protein
MLVNGIDNAGKELLSMPTAKEDVLVVISATIESSGAKAQRREEGSKGQESQHGKSRSLWEDGREEAKKERIT